MSAQATEQPKIVLHWLEKSRAQRIVWLLEECKVPYEIKTYKRYNKLAGPDLKKVHPLGKSPVVTIEYPGQTEPLTLIESAFITEYLSEHYAKHLIPAQWKSGQEGKLGGETEAWLRYRTFMHYTEGSLMTGMLLKYVVGSLAGPDVPFFIRPVTSLVVSKVSQMFLDPNMKTHLDWVESQLATSGGDYICGTQLTGADIMMSFTLMAAVGRIDQTLAKSYTNIMAYVQRLQNLDVFKTSVKKVEELTGEKYVVVG